MPPKHGELGRRLRALRKARWLAPAVLARRVGVSQNTVLHYEGGRIRPSPPVLRRLAAALGADREELAELAGYGPGAFRDV